jgi:predicted phage terminase large subunit-like protein
MSGEDARPLVDRLAALPAGEREGLLAALPPAVLAAALHCWPLWARPDQLPPEGRWRVWLLRSGRGAGKTRAGAEWVRSAVEAGRYGRLHLVGATHADVRDTMVEGPSGLLAVSPPASRPLYKPRLRRLEWANGARAFLFSAEEPDRLRGPQCEAAWCDELAAWRYPEAFDMLLMGLRLGSDPRCVVTTTPRPTKLVRSLIGDPATVVTVASTFANRANLPAAFFEGVLARYEGTRLARQELYGEVLEDVPGALWNSARLEELRVRAAPAELARVVVAVDPAVTSGEEADETGIVVVARSGDGHGYVLADHSGRYTPYEWAQLVARLYEEHRADRVIAEANQGGDLVKSNLRGVARHLPVYLVHASRGKYVRAEPVAALYEQGKVHHVGCFPTLEDQMCAFTPDMDRAIQGSPDRADALVWGLSELLIRERERRVATSHQG